MKKLLTLLIFVAGLQFSSFATQSWSVNDKNNNATATIFPNPANVYFTVSYNAAPGNYVEVFDVLGTVVARIDFTSESEVYVDSGEWKKGYYFCNFVSDGKVQKTLRLIIQR